MNVTPLVSVCINCYNAEHTIEATVQSVLTQTYPHLQVIVVDDCSADGTWERLQRFADDRLECVRLAQNGHISNANNEALRRVRGDFVAHLDADDTWASDKIERQLAFLQEHPRYGACFCLAEMVDEQDNPVEDHRFRAENRDQAALLRHFLTVGNYLCHSSMFARREVIDRVGEHDTSLLYFHDFDYWIRMAMVCDIYILPDTLVRYRLSDDSNSAMQERKRHGHIFEFAQIAYQSVTACPDALFLSAFADRLRLKDIVHTPEQIALEKAFLLCDLLNYLPENPALGLRRLSELMRETTYMDIARRDFGFTVRDLYALQGTPVYHDKTAVQNDRDHIVHLNNQLAALTAENGWHKEHTAQLEDERTRIVAHCAHLQHEHDQLLIRTQNAEQAAAHSAHQLALIHNSRLWKLTKPLRAIGRMRQIRRTSRNPLTRDGRRAACKVMLYGYFGHNLGDDLFFDTLFTRYPDTVFVVYDAVGYEDVFARYPNVYVYQRDRLGAAQSERLEALLLSHVDAVVHIGGSIYQQIGTWEEDLRMRKKRLSRRRPFFSISSNFGPFHSDSYRAFWHKAFTKSHDICMRDTASALLFADVKTVRRAPDLLFSLPLPNVDTVSGRLFVSVIDPFAAAHSFDEKPGQEYLDAMTAVVTEWLQSGREVVLSSFCSFEHDDVAVDTIVRAVPEELHSRLSVINYDGSGNFDAVLSALASSECVLATRFHATVFALTAGKTVVPVVYNIKTSQMLEDIGFSGYVERLITANDYFILRALEQPPCTDVSHECAAAISQLDRLDALIRKKGGTVC